MCGRMVRTNVNKIYERFNVDEHIDGLYDSYNVAPSQDIPVVLTHSPNHLELMRWGLIPFWAKDEKIGYKMINARADGIEKKPSFRKPFKSQRCIIPVSGFYEWKRTDKHKIPYYIYLKDQPVFGFAGLYDIAEIDGKTIHSCTVITTEPNSLMDKIHNRMPVILKKEYEEKWLDPELNDVEALLPILAPYPAKEMDAYQVSDKVNNPRNNTSENINKLN